MLPVEAPALAASSARQRLDCCYCIKLVGAATGVDIAIERSRRGQMLQRTGASPALQWSFAGLHWSFYRIADAAMELRRAALQLFAPRSALQWSFTWAEMERCRGCGSCDGDAMELRRGCNGASPDIGGGALKLSRTRCCVALLCWSTAGPPDVALEHCLWYDGGAGATRINTPANGGAALLDGEGLLLQRLGTASSQREDGKARKGRCVLRACDQRSHTPQSDGCTCS